MLDFFSLSSNIYISTHQHWLWTQRNSNTKFSTKRYIYIYNDTSVCEKKWSDIETFIQIECHRVMWINSSPDVSQWVWGGFNMEGNCACGSFKDKRTTWNRKWTIFGQRAPQANFWWSLQSMHAGLQNIDSGENHKMSSITFSHPLLASVFFWCVVMNLQTAGVVSKFQKNPSPSWNTVKKWITQAAKYSNKKKGIAVNSGKIIN